MLYMFVAIGFIRILLQRVKDLQADVFFLFFAFCRQQEIPKQWCVLVY